MQANPRGNMQIIGPTPAQDMKKALKQSELCAACFGLKQKLDPESTQMLLICTD